MAAGTIAGPDPEESIGGTPQLPPLQGQPPGPASSPSQPAAPGQLAPQPNGGIAQGVPGQKGEIATPAVVPEYDEKKLAKANTTLDLLNAMKPKSRTDYIDWWQKQHGDIDQRYDQLKTQLGARPADDEPQTKKEKFAALLEFGLHLMKNSAPASTNQGAVLTGTLSDEHDAMMKSHQASIEKGQSQYDTQADAIEKGRQDELKGIGTPAAAMAAQGKQNLDESTETKNIAQAAKAASDATSTKAAAFGPTTYATDGKGGLHALVRNEDGTSRAVPVTGIDGKPFAGKVLGRESGSGIDKTDTAAIRNQRYLTGVLGVDQDTATKIAFKPKSGSVDSDHMAVYKALLTASFGDEDKAKRGADQYILDNYGAGALTNAHKPLAQPQGPGAVPPPAALQGLQKGQVRHFGAKGDWTLGIDGKPVQVHAGTQAIQ